MGAEVGLLGSTVFMAVVWAVPRQQCPHMGYAGPPAGRAAALLQEKGLTSLQRAFTCSPFAQVQLHSAEYRVAATLAWIVTNAGDGLFYDIFLFF